jgi:hypothetical protein
VKVIVIVWCLVCFSQLGHSKANLECSNELTKGLAKFNISSLPPIYESFNVKKESSRFKNIKPDQGYVLPKTLWQVSDYVGLDFKETLENYSEVETRGSPKAAQNVLVYKKGNRISAFSVRQGDKATTYTLDENCNTTRVSENNVTLPGGGDSMAITKKFCSRTEASWIKMAKNTEALKREDASESQACSAAGGKWDLLTGCICETQGREGIGHRYLSNPKLEDCNGQQHKARYVLEANLEVERGVRLGRLTEGRVQELKKLCANNADMLNSTDSSQPAKDETSQPGTR